MNVSKFARVKFAARNYHVDFVSTLIDSHTHIVQLNFQRRVAAGESRGDRGDFDLRTSQFLFRQRHEVWINADRRYRREACHRIVEVLSLITQLFDFAGRVHALERGQIDHAQHHLEPLHFGLGFDAACLKTFGALDHADLVDRR